MAVRHVERPLEMIGLNRVEKPLRLLDIVRQVVHLGVFGFQIVILKIDRHIGLFGPMHQPLHAVYRSIAAQANIPEVIAPVPDEPTATQSNRQIEIGIHIVLNRFGQNRHVLGIVNRRRRMHPNLHRVLFAQIANALDAHPVKRGQIIGRHIGLKVDVVKPVCRAPSNALFQRHGLVHVVAESAFGIWGFGGFHDNLLRAIPPPLDTPAS